jgi:RimJ/RimL family protein N-acetyltransferase
MLETGDLDRLIEYRNDPEVARYQEWPMPFTRGDAERLLADQVDQVGPAADGRMVQLAVVADGRMIGDVAVGIRPGGAIASIGYTLARDAQGRGHARTVVAALVDALFAHGVRRIDASTDPANLASIRVLDLTGFRCEGLAREADEIRGEWLDDLRFGLLAADRAEWLARPRTFERFELRELQNADARAVAALQTHRHQIRLVSPIGKSLAEAIAPPESEGHPVRPWYRVIVADGEVAGFVMVALPTPPQPEPYLWRLLIDRRHQSRGLGTATIAALAERFRNEGHPLMTVSFVPGLGSPQRFYERLGFRLNGREDDGELEADLAL